MLKINFCYRRISHGNACYWWAVPPLFVDLKAFLYSVNCFAHDHIPVLDGLKADRVKLSFMDFSVEFTNKMSQNVKMTTWVNKKAKNILRFK